MLNLLAEHKIEAKLSEFDKHSFLSKYDVYQTFLDVVVNHFDSEIGYLHLYDENAEELNLAVWSQGVFSQCTTVHDTHYPLKKAGIWADAIRNRSTVVHNDYPSKASVSGLPDGHFPVSRHMSTIVERQGKIVAIIGLGNKPTHYTEQDKDAFEKVVSRNWSFVETKNHQIDLDRVKLQESFNSNSAEDVLIAMVRSIGRTLELKDAYTSDHHKNVALLCDRIAEVIGMSDHRRLGLQLGSLIHDIGKVAVPAQILTKPSKLTHAEYSLIKSHALEGASIFDGVALPWPIKEMIAQHHERFDGSGYPFGLQRDEICLEARIIAVADTFDAMASDRPYRKAPGQKLAIEALKLGRGQLFDPYIVDTFIAILSEEPDLYPQL